MDIVKFMNTSYSFAKSFVQNGARSTNGRLFFEIAKLTGSGLVAYFVANRVLSYLFKSPTKKLLETRGHFLFKENEKYHEEALKLTIKCFDRIVKQDANNGWDWIYLNEKEEICKSTIGESSGSCHGNCLALARAIVKKGKILTAHELKEVEAHAKFPKRAMGFQMTQNMREVINTRVSEANRNPDRFERPSQLSLEENELLGQRTEHFKYQRHIDCLRTYGLSIAEVAQLSQQEYKILSTLILFSISLQFAKEKIFKKGLDLSGKEFIQKISEWGGFPNTIPLPDKKRQMLPALSTIIELDRCVFFPKQKGADFKAEDPFILKNQLTMQNFEEKFLQIKSENFSGFFTISAKPYFFQKNEEGGAHALLMEVDNRTKTYVLYDNNLGFYSGDSLQDCLNLLNSVEQTYKHDFLKFFPYVLTK